MKQKELTKTFMMISNCTKSFDSHGLHTNDLALYRLSDFISVTKGNSFFFALKKHTTFKRRHVSPAYLQMFIDVREGITEGHENRTMDYSMINVVLPESLFKIMINNNSMDPLLHILEDNNFEK